MSVPGIEQLRKICYPSKAQRLESYRRVSIYFVWILLHFPVTPNMVTFSRVIFLSLGFYYMLAGKMLIAALILQFCILLDTFDGAIARYRKMTSKIGEFYDFVLDHISAAMLYFLGIGIFLHLSGYKYHLIISLLTVALANLAFVARVIYSLNNVDVTNLGKRRLFIFFYQDNWRHIINLLSIGAVAWLFYDYAIAALNILFLIMFIVKVCYLSIIFRTETGKFAFSRRNLGKVWHEIISRLTHLISFKKR
jgi:phosphatidylglycerophosphate synthase